MSGGTSALRQVAALAGAGLQFAVTVALSAAAGWWADGRLGTSPWLLIVGAIVGAVAAFIQLYRALLAASAPNPEEDRDD